jgi:hypothetical protein
MGSAFLALGEQRVIDGAALIFAEAIFQRVIQMIEAEIFAAPSVGTIQKRTMLATFAHMRVACSSPTLVYRQRRGICVNYWNWRQSDKCGRFWAGVGNRATNSRPWIGVL